MTGLVRRLGCRWFAWHTYGNSRDSGGLRIATCTRCGRRLIGLT